MRHVSIAELKANAEELVAAAESGEDIAIVREGRDVIKLSLIAPVRSMLADTRTPEQRAAQRAAVDAAYALGQEILRAHGPTTSAERRAWIEDGRA